MTRRAILEAVEPRRLFTFAALDADFGSGGVVKLTPGTVGSHADASVSPLKDGRILIHDPYGIQYLNGSGGYDKKRGDAGTGRVQFDLAKSRLTVDSAVDPSTGRLVSLYYRSSETSRQIMVEVRDAKGKVEKTFRVQAGGPMKREQARVAFTSDGGFVVALPHVLDSTVALGLGVTVYKYDKANKAAASYNGGKSELSMPLTGLTRGTQDVVKFNNLLPDGNNRVYFVYSTSDVQGASVGNSDVRARTAVARTTSTGTLDVAYSGTQGRTLADSTQVHGETVKSQYIQYAADVTVAADGVVYGLIESAAHARHGRGRRRIHRAAPPDRQQGQGDRPHARPVATRVGGLLLSPRALAERIRLRGRDRRPRDRPYLSRLREGSVERRLVEQLRRLRHQHGAGADRPGRWDDQRRRQLRRRWHRPAAVRGPDHRRLHRDRLRRPARIVRREAGDERRARRRHAARQRHRRRRRDRGEDQERRHLRRRERR
ncbi:MAG: hypothetical protein QM702_03650 [Rubrivivax sp.]